jgi:GntR family transcriptional repressor for pyruvate dehydrogenase complex
MVDDAVADRTLAEHQAIYDALAAGDSPLAQAAALMHVATTEQWLREHLAQDPDGRTP